MDGAKRTVFEDIDRLTEARLREGDNNFALPASIISDLEQEGVRAEELDRIVGSKEEILSLVRANKDLPQNLKEAVSRIAHIVSLAETIFGDRDKAFLWLRLPNITLNRKEPIKLIETESGARIIEETLLRLEHGIPS